MNEENLIDNHLSSADRGREPMHPVRDASLPEAADHIPRRLLIVAPHVVQYSSPLFREIAHRPHFTVLVAYCSMQGAESGVDPGFGVKVSWDTAQLEGYPWVHVPNRPLIPAPGQFFGLFNPGLWKIIKEGNFDAVWICGYYFASAWIAIAAAKSSATPIIFVTDSHSLQSWRAQSKWKIQIKKQLVKRIFSFARAMIVSSTGGVEYVASLGFPPDRISLAPTAVDNAWWLEQAAMADRSAVRAAWNIPEGAPVALFCAKLQPWKGPMDLLEAFARANVPESFLVFAGDGPERIVLQRRASELGLAERVRILGFVNQSQLPPAYCAADLLVLPSLFEPFGLVVNEAMLCGLPVVVSDRVGARFDLVRPGENGFVFPAGNVEALAAILRQSLPDMETRARLGAAARRRMETWSPREYVDGVVHAVNVAAKKKSSS
jgi:glycosyltransferase involved in cell wall biosynthesis